MILNKVGSYLLQKRAHAIWVALLCSLLPLLQVPTNWIAISIMALVTLHKGAKEGLLVVAWIILPTIVFLWLGDALPFLMLSIARILVVWFLACLLGSTVSWRSSLQLLAGCGVVGILLAHAIVPDLTGWWLSQFTHYWPLISQQLQLNLSDAEAALLLGHVAQFATGMVLTLLLGFDVVLLVIARAWQALLFNPGGFSKEWRLLRMNFWYSTLLLVVILLAWLDVSTVFKDILPVLCVPLFFSGLSFIHAKLPEKKSIRLPWLILLYALLVLFFPYVAVLLVALGFVDSCYDFRSPRASAV